MGGEGEDVRGGRGQEKGREEGGVKGEREGRGRKQERRTGKEREGRKGRGRMVINVYQHDKIPIIQRCPGTMYNAQTYLTVTIICGYLAIFCVC